jgi:lysozyme
MDALDMAERIAMQFEGYSSPPYRCPAGVPSIGYGATRYETGRRVSLGDPPIDRERAAGLLRWEMGRSMAAALRHCPVLALAGRDTALAAIADFVFNLGPGRLQASTLRRRINQQNWPEARKELLRWVRGGGKVLPGLVARRRAEARLI